MEVCEEVSTDQEPYYDFEPGDVLELRDYAWHLYALPHLHTLVSRYYLVVKTKGNNPDHWRLFGLETGNIWDHTGPRVWAPRFRKVNACLKIKE